MCIYLTGLFKRIFILYYICAYDKPRSTSHNKACPLLNPLQIERNHFHLRFTKESLNYIAMVPSPSPVCSFTSCLYLEPFNKIITLNSIQVNYIY